MQTAENKTAYGDILERLNGKKRRYFSLRMAPMIDMIFLLLIFFLVAAKWRPQEDFLPIQLPYAQPQTRNLGKPEPLIIHIFATETGCQVQIGQFQTIQIENQTIEANLATLMVKINDCLLAQKRFADDPVEIICEKEVKWEYLAKIYNIFFGTGLTDITFQMTEQPQNGHLD